MWEWATLHPYLFTIIVIMIVLCSGEAISEVAERGRR